MEPIQSQDDKLKMYSAPQMSSLDRECPEESESSQSLPSVQPKLDSSASDVKDTDVCPQPQQAMSDCIVEVSNISDKVTEKDLRQLFEVCGEILECELRSIEATSRFLPEDSTQTARLTFATSEAADVAELLSGALLSGQSVRVQRCHPQAEQPKSEGEHLPTEQQWGYIRKLGDLTGRGYVIGQKAINYLVWFDDRYNITKSLGEKAHQLDEKTGLSSSLSTVITSAKDRWREVEQNHPTVAKAEEILSSGLTVAGERVNATAEMLKNTSLASRGSEVIEEFKSAVQESIDSGDVKLDQPISDSADVPNPESDETQDLSKEDKPSSESKDKLDLGAKLRETDTESIHIGQDQSGYAVGKQEQLNVEGQRHSELLGQGGNREGGGL